MSPTHALFIGAGAVGSFYASRLQHASHSAVSLVARSNYKAIVSSGIHLDTHTFGKYDFKPTAVYPNVDEASKATHPWDILFVTTKALPDVSDDSKLLVPLVGPETVIVLIQNGLGVETPYRQRFPDTPIISAITVISAEQTSPGHIQQNRWTRISLAPYTDGRGTGSSILTEKATNAMETLKYLWGELGGIKDVEPHDEVDLQLLRWHKLCINAAMNPSAVLSGGRPNAEMVMEPELREHLKGVMEEIRAAVPKILGREFPESLAGSDKIIKSTERNTGGRPSMLVDWEAGRPLEVEVILGNPVRIARQAGVELPRVQTLYALLKSAQYMRQQAAKSGKEDDKAKL